MAWQSLAAGVVILSLAALWYGLQAVSLRDLRTRPGVRGDNKLLWAFAILCLPYVGALGYLSLGPTSFLPRTRRTRAIVTGTTRRPTEATGSRGARGADGVAPPLRPRVAGSIDRDARRPPVATLSGIDRRRSVGLGIDPVIGTDSTDLLPVRPAGARRARPAQMTDAIRWPGTGGSQGWHHADADVHD